MTPGNPSPLVQEFVRQGFAADCPIIDMHGHPGRLGSAYLPVAEAPNLRNALRRAGVARLVGSAHQALLDDVDAGNAYMQQVIDVDPAVFLGYWSVNPNRPDAVARAPAELEAARGFIGFKLLPDYHVYPLTGSAYVPVLEHAEAKGLLVLVHTWGGSAFDGPRLVADVAARYPRAVFLMGHSGYGDWETAAQIARDCPNVYLELTAVYVAHDFAMLPGGSGTPLPFGSCLQVNGIIEYLVETAGSRKIVHGTDLPWYSPHYAAGAVLFARITDEDRRNILYRNADALLPPTARLSRGPSGSGKSGR